MFTFQSLWFLSFLSEYIIIIIINVITRANFKEENSVDEYIQKKVSRKKKRFELQNQIW